MILREGLVITLGGAAPGMLLAFGIGRRFGGVLYQVSATDPVVFTLSLAVLVVSACSPPGCPPAGQLDST